LDELHKSTTLRTARATYEHIVQHPIRSVLTHRSYDPRNVSSVVSMAALATHQILRTVFSKIDCRPALIPEWWAS